MGIGVWRAAVSPLGCIESDATEHAKVITVCFFVDLLFFRHEVLSNLCDTMDSGMLGFPILHYLLKLAQIYVHCVGDAIQTSHPLPPSSPPAFNLSHPQGLFQ